FLAAQERTTVGGYGEIHYTNRTGPNSPGQVNLRRFVLYLAHTFDDRLAFRSELEVEDAKLESGEPGGEVALEQAYLDYRLAGRLEWAQPGLKVGGSFWYGGTANQDSVLGNGTFAAPITLVSADARYEVGGIMLRGVVASISVSDAQAIDARYGGTVGSRIA